MLDVMEMLVAGTRYGVPLDRVVEVAPRVHVSPLPGTAAPLVGYLSYRGRALPAVDLRALFGVTAATEPLEEHIVIARAARRPVALLVDRALGLISVDTSALAAPPVSSKAVAGIVPLSGGLLFIADLDAVLSLEEERAVDDALARLGVS